jgi:hypothetical protein
MRKTAEQTYYDVTKNYNFLKGVRSAREDMGLSKVAEDESEEQLQDVLDSSLAESMEESDIVVPEEGELPEDQVLEAAQAMVELADAVAAEQGLDVDPEIANVEDEIADLTASEPALEEDVKTASIIARNIKRALEESANPAEISELQSTDYTTKPGGTSLDTSKGEVGAQRSVGSQMAAPVTTDANIAQTQEGSDIAKKDYTVNPGQTSLDTSKGEVGSETAVKQAARRNEALGLLAIQRALLGK